MGAFIDLTGQKQQDGRLKALSVEGKSIGGNYMWRCVCSCGAICIVRSVDFRNGNTKSCGCFNLDSISERAQKNIKGRLFGKLTAICCVGRDRFRSRVWLCVCECGSKCKVTTAHLLSGHTRSCGCIRDAGTNNKHGHCKGKISITYNSWANMLQRGENHNGCHPEYTNVHVCKRWTGPKGFEHFLADMGPRPAGTTLSRFGDTGDYKPSNCAWHTPKQQQAEARKKRLRDKGTQ